MSTAKAGVTSAKDVEVEDCSLEAIHETKDCNASITVDDSVPALNLRWEGQPSNRMQAKQRAETPVIQMQHLDCQRHNNNISSNI